MTNLVDLQTHSTMSDGVLSPEELVKQAHSIGLQYLAITDHDTIDGVKIAQETGRLLGIEVIAGAELSLEWGGRTVEILGFMFDPDDRALNEMLDMRKIERMERGKITLAQLREIGIDIEWNHILELAGGVVGRPHIAWALVELGYVRDPKEAFDKYLGKGKPGYVPGGKNRPVAVGVKILHEAGGVAIIAHPFMPEDPSYLNIDEFLPVAASIGIDGLEAYYTGYSPELTRRLEQLATNHNMIVTGGSDFHGGAQAPNNRLGAVEVPLKCVQNLKERARIIQSRLNSNH